MAFTFSLLLEHSSSKRFQKLWFMLMTLLLLLTVCVQGQQLSSVDSTSLETPPSNLTASEKYTINDDCKEECTKPTKTMHMPSPLTVLSENDELYDEVVTVRRTHPLIGISASLFMIPGAFIMIFGFPYFRATMAFVGAAFGYVVCWVALQAGEPLQGYPNTLNLYFGVCLSGAFVMSLVFLFFYKLGLYSLCLMSGVLLSLHICCWREDFVISNILHRSIFTLFFMLLFLLGLIFLEFATVIVSMGLLGAHLFLIGLDLILRTGFNTGLSVMLDFNEWRNKHSEHHLNSLIKRNAISVYRPDDWRVRTMLGSVLGLIVLSALFQRWYNRGHRFGLCIVRTSNDTLHKYK